MQPSTTLLICSPKYGIRFKRSIEVDIVHYDDDPATYIEYDPWDIYGTGSDLDDAIDCWWEDLGAIYSDLKRIVEDNPDGLGARFERIKQEMDELIEPF